jgi:hypothetical protein
MATFLLDAATGDFDLSTGTIVLTTDKATEYRQKMQARLSAFQGEWRYDLASGLPWYEKILIKNPKLADVREILKRAILSVPGTVSVTFTSFNFDAGTRTLSIAFRTTTDFQSTPINFNQTYKAP